MIWTIDLIDDSNRTGSMEFVVSAADPESFYPVEVGKEEDQLKLMASAGHVHVRV